LLIDIAPVSFTFSAEIYGEIRFLKVLKNTLSTIRKPKFTPQLCNLVNGIKSLTESYFLVQAACKVMYQTILFPRKLKCFALEIPRQMKPENTVPTFIFLTSQV